MPSKKRPKGQTPPRHPDNNPVSPPKKHKIVATLDLHGRTTNDAIRCVTDFLERHGKASACWVCIVTGRGSHGQDGPVLRSAVQRLLDKRRMTYELEPKHKSSFWVQANSGFALYSSTTTPQDSKVILVPRDNDDTVDKPAVVVRHPTNKQPALLDTRRHFDLLPHQVMQDDDLIQRVKETSHRQHQQEQRGAQRDFKRALSESAMEYQRHTEQVEEQYKADLERALTCSSREHKEEYEIDHVVDKEDELLLEKVLALSDKEYNINKINNQDNDDEILKKVLELSQQNMGNEDNDLENVLLMSLTEVKMTDEDWLQHGINISLSENH